jgi:hypothetical protein
MQSEGLWVNAQDHYEEKLDDGLEGEWAISVFSADGLSAAEICVCAEIPHPKVRLSSVGALRQLGFDVVPTDDLHADLKLPRDPDEEMWNALRSAFSEPERNPRLEVPDA